MDKTENNKIVDMETNVFKQKADSILFVIRNINRQGGIVTQLMMAAACIEVLKFVYFLQDITHSEEKDIRLIDINQTRSDIDK